MKNYDYNKAKQIIGKDVDLSTASLGMAEDWTWTAQTIWEDGNFTVECDDPSGRILVAGIDGSNWATPTLVLSYKDGRETRQDCFSVESGHVPAEAPSWVTDGGPLSRPANEGIASMSVAK